MKTLKEITEILLEEYTRGGYDSKYNGLCFLLVDQDVDQRLTPEEIRLFEDYMWDWAEANVEWNWHGGTNERIPYGRFMGYVWDARDKEVRIQWLKDQLLKM